jgi:hypothetical protein
VGESETITRCIVEIGEPEVAVAGEQQAAYSAF